MRLPDAYYYFVLLTLLCMYFNTSFFSNLKIGVERVKPFAICTINDGNVITTLFELLVHAPARRTCRENTAYIISIDLFMSNNCFAWTKLPDRLHR